MPVHVLSLLETFDAPVPMDRLRFIESELARFAIAEAARDGIPGRCRVSFGQLRFASIDDAVAEIRDRCRGGVVVVLTPSDLAIGRALSAATAAMPCILLHQNLDPASAEHPLAFRLGVGDREHKASAAVALLAIRRCGGAVFVGASAPAKALSALPGLVAIDPPVDASGVEGCARRIAQSLASGGTVLLECGGELNRALARALAGRADVIFLNGNPDACDAAVAARLTEVVGNLPDRIGGKLASALAVVTGGASQAELDAVGMLAWRIDALRLVLEAVHGVGDASPDARSLAAWIGACDGRQRIFRGWHRPIWFDASRRNACVEAVAARVDIASGRRVADCEQVAPDGEGRFTRVPSLALDVDVVEVGRIDEAMGTFEAEAAVRVVSDTEWSHLNGPQCIRVLNSVGEPTWAAVPGRGPGAYLLRGTFRFEPDLIAYPLDSQLLTVRIAATGTHAAAIVRAMPRGADMECECAGWRVLGGHRGITYAVRPTPDGQPAAVQGVEFGVRMRRTRRDVQVRVGLPLAILVAIAAAALLAGGAERAEMVAGILASLFLSAVALYFAEPKPSAGARTLIDAIYARAFVLLAVLLVGALLAMRLPAESYSTVVLFMAALLPFACLALVLSIRVAVGPWRWRSLRM